MNSAGNVLFAWMPPTLAAARYTVSTFSAAKKARTAAWSVRSSVARGRVMSSACGARALNWRTRAAPAMPQWPATKVVVGVTVFMDIGNAGLVSGRLEVRAVTPAAYLGRVLDQGSPSRANRCCWPRAYEGGQRPEVSHQTVRKAQRCVDQAEQDADGDKRSEEQPA